jgi:hypothetical protein
MYSFTHSLTSAQGGSEWSASRSGHFTPREIAPDTLWIGGWVGPRDVLDTVVKRKIPSPCQESKIVLEYTSLSKDMVMSSSSFNSTSSSSFTVILLFDDTYITFSV